MPLEDYYPWSVVFIVVPSTREDGTAYNAPRGTGFIVSCDGETQPLLIHQYVVTASHVVSDGAATKIRLKSSEQTFMDVDVPEWLHHPTADVAIAPLRVPGSMLRGQRPITVSIESDRFVGAGAGRTDKDIRFLGPAAISWEPELGERVYFMGLFDRFGEMGERNIPMTRSGCVGALNVPHVPIGPPENQRYVQAHLIDCRSYAGFSGSPCFVQRDMRRQPMYDDASGRIDTETALLGIVSGHFDMWGTARLTGDLPIDPGSVKVPLNTGVGVVTPAKAIREAMDMEELADDRKRVEEDHAAGTKSSDDEGATLDSTETEYGRFERLARKLVHTPKPEPKDK